MNWYAKAIEMLSREDLDYKVIAYNLAKTHPKAFVIAATGDLERNCRNLLRSGHKLEAIKHCKEVSGMSLRDAREFVEALERN